MQYCQSNGFLEASCFIGSVDVLALESSLFKIRVFNMTNLFLTKYNAVCVFNVLVLLLVYYVNGQI